MSIRGICFLSAVLLSLLAILLSCGEPSLPSRDQIPAIKAQLSKVEAGVRGESNASLDSLMSVEMLEQKLTSDSLIAFVWNQLGVDHTFTRFIDCDIAYTAKVSQCNCELVNETGARSGTIKLTFNYQDSTWLVKSFGLGESKPVQPATE